MMMIFRETLRNFKTTLEVLQLLILMYLGSLSLAFLASL